MNVICLKRLKKYLERSVVGSDMQPGVCRPAAHVLISVYIQLVRWTDGQLHTPTSATSTASDVRRTCDHHTLY